MNNPNEERPVISKLGFAVWIRQAAIALFSLAALCTAVVVVILVLQDTQEDRLSNCRTDISGDLLVAESELNTTGWRLLVSFSATPGDPAPEQAQQAIAEMEGLIEKVQRAQSRREKIDEIC